MSDPVVSNGSLSRRQALRLGGLAGAAGLAGTRPAPAAPRHGGLPVSEIEDIIAVRGTVSGGVLNLQVDRADLAGVTKDGVPVKPAFQLNGNLFFQCLPGGSVMMNGDLCFKPEELNPAIDQMMRHGLVWQAMHQHLFDLEPMVWFMHMRGCGSARDLAQGCAAVLAATSTPLPQAPPRNPVTPLDAGRLAAIIGGPATVGADGVVSFQLPHREQITLGGVRVSPYLNVSTPVAFQPLGGDRAAAVPDFGMTAAQIGPLTRLMRARGWEIHCLYNQETDEQPQLYFSHQYKIGNAYALATEIRDGLELTGSVLA